MHAFGGCRAMCPELRRGGGVGEKGWEGGEGGAIWGGTEAGGGRELGRGRGRGRAEAHKGEDDLPAGFGVGGSAVG